MDAAKLTQRTKRLKDCDDEEVKYAKTESSEDHGTSSSRPPSKNTLRQLWTIVLRIALAVVIGIIFGVAQEKGRVFEPRAIRYQMIFKKMIMMKMFLAALATGMFFLSLLAMLPFTSGVFFRVCNKFFNRLADKGIVSSVLGGFALGIGITLTGSCPTSVFVQIGTQVPNAGYTLAGGLCGTLIYGVFKPIFDKISKPTITEASNPWINSPYFIMAMPVAVMFGMLVASFEILVPWTKDVKVENPDLNLFAVKAWPPYISGILIGALQVPLVLGLEETLGGSSSLLTMLSCIFIGPLKRLSPFIAKYRFGFDSWWQIFYVAGIIYGAYWSSLTSGYIGKGIGVPASEAFIGGVLMLLGARIAGGCTSGHGITGMGFLSILSVITVSCMFAGAIITAYIMHAFKLLRL